MLIREVKKSMEKNGFLSYEIIEKVNKNLNKLKRKFKLDRIDDINSFIFEYKSKFYSKGCLEYHPPDFCLEGSCKVCDIEVFNNSLKNGATNYKESFLQAAKSGFLEGLKTLFEFIKDEKNIIENGILNASKKGHLDIVIFLFNVDMFSYLVNEIIMTAIYGGKLNIIEHMIKYDNSEDFNEKLKYAIENGERDIFSYFIKTEKITSLGISEAFVDACRYGQIYIIRELIETKNISNYAYSSGLVYACKYGFENIVDIILDQAKIFLRGYEKSIIISIKNNYIDILEKLINIDNYDDFSYFLEIAIEYKRIEIVYKLISTKKVSNDMIKLAIEKGLYKTPKPLKISIIQEEPKNVDKKPPPLIIPKKNIKKSTKINSPKINNDINSIDPSRLIEGRKKNAYTIIELRNIAKDLGLSLKSSSSKSDFANAIKEKLNII
jgi:hypothetical protein